MTDQWDDLADDELLARLIQRGGLHPAVAENLVNHRDDEEYIEIIDGLLHWTGQAGGPTP